MYDARRPIRPVHIIPHPDVMLNPIRRIVAATDIQIYVAPLLVNTPRIGIETYEGSECGGDVVFVEPPSCDEPCYQSEDESDQ